MVHNTDLIQIWAIHQEPEYLNRLHKQHYKQNYIF